MFHLKPANLEVVVMFLVSLLLGALFAERYASEYLRGCWATFLCGLERSNYVCSPKPHDIAT